MLKDKADIKICVLTKGDKKLANIISKKYIIKELEDDKNEDKNQLMELNMESIKVLSTSIDISWE